MLLKSKLVHVPAPEEVEADLNEYGMLSTQTSAAYGRAAVEAGTGDTGEHETFAADVIANILHTFDSTDEARTVFERAWMHYEAEARGEKPSR